MATVVVPPKPPRPTEFEKAMVFIDGTNLFNRLDGAKIILKKSLASIVAQLVEQRQIVRIYLYTIEQHYQTALKRHGGYLSEQIRVVYGQGIPTGDGNLKEKGVDALLVADLIYHAAMKNYDYALLISTDTDFVHAMRRVEDFGCRTGVVAFCTDVPERLRSACDGSQAISKDSMIDKNLAYSRRIDCESDERQQHDAVDKKE